MERSHNIQIIPLSFWQSAECTGIRNQVLKFSPASDFLTGAKIVILCFSFGDFSFMVQISLTTGYTEKHGIIERNYNVIT